MRKRILSVLLATVMLVSLSGCGATEEKVNDTQTEKTAVEETAEVEPEEAKEEVIAEPVAVEITLENWEDYFILEDVALIYKNDFDEFDNIHLGYALTLREEYANKLALESDAYPLKVAFEVKHSCDYKSLTLDATTGAYELSEEIYIEDAASHEIGETDIISLSDNREADFDGDIATFAGKVSAIHLDNSTCEYQDLKLKRDFKDFEILRAEGTLYLYE